MLRVGIMSMQRIANYGSILQAYALKNLLQNLGCQVEFVDYHIGDPIDGKQESSGIVRKIKKIRDAFQIGAPVSETFKFIKYKKNFQKNYWPVLGISEQRNYNPELDLLVIGSDEVFNCLQDNTNVGFSPELFGENNNAKKVISYAASFGNTTVERLIEKGVLNDICSWMKNFDDLSVRDKNSQDVLKKLGYESSIHLDPVLTYDFKEEKQMPFKKPDYKYLILYGYSGRFTKEECDEIREYANRKGLKIINIGGVQKCCDRFIDCSPNLVIRWFMNAECVITDTFHGSILSIITERPFAAYIRKNGYGNFEKLSDLLNRLSLEDRAVTDRFEDVLETPIDWSKTQKIIQEYRGSAINYLKAWTKGGQS